MRKQSSVLLNVPRVATQLDRIMVDGRAPPDQDRALGRLLESVEHPQQRRLAAPALTDENDRFPGGHGEVDTT